MERPDAAERSTPTTTIVVLCLLPLVIHLAVNLFGGYGYFRDELYYIACAKRLGAGYVDHPPLSIYVLALVRLLIGDSVFAIRLVPAVTSALSVAVVCGLVLKMQGGRAALIVAALAFVCSGQLLGYHAFYSMNSLDILFWLVAAYVLAGLVEHATTRNPTVVLAALLGLGFYLFSKDGRRFRPLGAVFLTVFTILFLNPHSKAEYIAAGYTLVFAGGGVAIERLGRGWGHAIPVTAAALLVLFGVVIAPFALPMLPVETYVRYAQALGVEPSTAEAKKLAELHNSYWFLGVGATPITTFIRLGGTQDDYRGSYGDVTQAGVHTSRYCMPYENDLGVVIARQRRVPIEEAWNQLKHFE